MTAASQDVLSGRPGDPLLQAVLSSMPYGFSIWSEEQRLVLFNQTYLDIYGYADDMVRPGMTLREICVLTVALGNSPGFSPEELYVTYVQRLRSVEVGKVLRAQKTVRDRIIKTNHIRTPGLGWIITHEDVTEEVQGAERERERDLVLQKQSQRFEAALDSMLHGVSMYDAERRLVAWNRTYLELYGLPEELARPGTPLQEILAFRAETGAEEVPIEPYQAEDVLEGPSREEQRTLAYRLKDGRLIAVTVFPMPDGGIVAMHRDITREIERLDQLRDSKARLASQNMRLEAAVNNISQGLCMFDAEERMVICNEAYRRIYRLPAALTQPGTPLSDILDYRFAHGMAPKTGPSAFLAEHRTLIDNAAYGKHLVDQEDGRSMIINHHPTADGGWVATHEDVTEQRRMEARIEHLARHDPLTDLPNRVLFREEMDKAEARIRRDEVVAVLCVDLDHFKAVNDRLGHGVGDAVLIAVAERLKEASRGTDVVARLGGDEFAVLACGLEGPRGAATVAGRIVKSLGRPVLVDEQEIQLGASVGIALAPMDGSDGETLLKKADLALYRAKGAGRGNYHFFERSMDDALQARRALEQDLRLALSRKEFRLVYQPLLSLEDSRISGVEALLRWDHPERGVIAPLDFIPLAEETGLILPIGEWVLREACRAAANWPAEVRIAVNLSAVQFRNRALVNQVASALHDSGVEPNRLELEITESVLLTETDLTLETLHRLRGLGVRIAMDDFGTGYSSLSYLRAFPFDRIKIDRSFIADVDTKKDGLAIVSAMIGLGRSLGITTTAEGIETEAQLAAVRGDGCSEVQGFLLSPPLPASGVDALLGGRTPLAVHRAAEAS